MRIRGVHPAKDACKLCRDKDKAVVRPSDLTSDDLSDVKNREYTLISESGLYRILAKCNLPKCEPWFVAKDVCDCLEIADVSQACKNLDDDEKQVVARSPELSLLFTESSNAPTMTLISEAVSIAFSPNAIFRNANRGLSQKTCVIVLSLGTFCKRAVDLTRMRGVSF